MRVPAQTPGRILSPQAGPRPVILDSFGYAQAHREKALTAVCARFGVRQLGSPKYGPTGKSIGVSVTDAAGQRSWVKVAGLPRHLPDPLFANEMSANALRGLPKPQILAQGDDILENIRWRSMKMTLASCETISTTPWLEDGTAVTGVWIEELRAALRSLAEIKDNRGPGNWPAHLQRLITQRFGPNAPYVVDEWHLAHCDLQWANLTAPQLMILDWEHWGVAPRGYDCATLLAYSVLDPALVIRLEHAFSQELETRAGVVSTLAVCAGLLGLIEQGWLRADLFRPVEQLALRAIARR